MRKSRGGRRFLLICDWAYNYRRCVRAMSISSEHYWPPEMEHRFASLAALGVVTIFVATIAWQGGGCFLSKKSQNHEK